MCERLDTRPLDVFTHDEVRAPAELDHLKVRSGMSISPFLTILCWI